jgi:hypothetical protein
MVVTARRKMQIVVRAIFDMEIRRCHGRDGGEAWWP